MFERIIVINDTIATLFSGLSKSKVDGYIGLIVSTGTNMATFFDSKNIPKIAKISNWEGSIPVNLESGNFNPPHLTEFDKELDIHSENPGVHRFEKVISGLYLGRIFKTIFPDSEFDPDSGARGIVEIINKAEQMESNYIFAALKIYERSAKLVSASIAGLIALLSEYRRIEKIRIVAEGSLLWSEVNGKKHYFYLVQDTLLSLLENLKLSGLEVKISEIDKATLTGTAIAAL
ncbi:MAG: hypothetical protein JSU83_05425 [Deltaproteobacteria bacterium]|nr:MAG: hypothetical protein JSU83_05425 [Deltaproteobacteria bacterium]